MLELPYSLVIEATEEPDFFGFYSPDLEGFTGIGHSVEDCLYQAKWGMQEFVQLMVELNMEVPPRSEEPTVLIKNTSRDTGTYQTEQLMREDPRVQRLLGHKKWRHPAEAAIAFYSRGEACNVEGWKDTSTWKQVRAVYEEVRRRQPGLPAVLVENR